MDIYTELSEEKDFDLEIKGKLRESSITANVLKDFIGSKGWEMLRQHLESRYVEVSESEDIDSLEAVKARNARLDEIRRIFKFVKYEFDSASLSIRRLQEELELNDEHVPSPYEL